MKIEKSSTGWSWSRVICVSFMGPQSSCDPIYMVVNHMFTDCHIGISLYFTWKTNARTKISLQYSNLVKPSIRSECRYLVSFFITLSTRLNGGTAHIKTDRLLLCALWPMAYVCSACTAGIVHTLHTRTHTPMIDSFIFFPIGKFK